MDVSLCAATIHVFFVFPIDDFGKRWAALSEVGYASKSFPEDVWVRISGLNEYSALLRYARAVHSDTHRKCVRCENRSQYGCERRER